MSRPSSIDRLPASIRAEIGKLRMQGRTIDEILAALQAMGAPAVSRSAMGRHLKSAEKLTEALLHSRQVAEILVREVGERPESQTARMNIELMHAAIMRLFMNSAEGQDVDESGAAALDGNPEGVMMLSKAMDHLARASKSNEEFIARAEQRATAKAKQDAAAAVETVGREKGISAETLAAIKAGIFGVRAAGA